MQTGFSLTFSTNSPKMVSRVGEKARFVNTENGNMYDCILKTIPRQTADGTGELIFNILYGLMWK